MEKLRYVYWSSFLNVAVALTYLVQSLRLKTCFSVISIHHYSLGVKSQMET